MSVYIRLATAADEAACNTLAKRSPYTRDFANPPLSLKAMRKVAFTENQVYAAVVKSTVVGFVWSRPMKPRHMPFCTVYYAYVDTAAVGRGGTYKLLLEHALKCSAFWALELVVEHGNAKVQAYFGKAAKTVDFFGKRTCVTAVKEGFVGKDARPYTRWRISYEA